MSAAEYDEIADPDHAVYFAEECGWEMVDEDVAEMAHAVMLPEEVSAFALLTLRAAGYDIDEAPTFVYDIPDDAYFAGQYVGATDVIRLHPMTATRSVVLHELAHWTRPRDGHRSQYCGSHLHLIGAAFDRWTRNEMAHAYVEAGIGVDWNWSEMTADEVAKVGVTP